MAMAAGSAAGHDPGMQHLAAERPTPSPTLRLKNLVGLLSALLLVAVGLLAGWLVATTPFLSALVTAHPTTVQTLLGAIGWAAGLSLPVLLTGAGLLRLARSVGALRPRRPRSPIAQLVAHLPDDHALVEGVRLSDGRRIPAVVVGPFGAAVLEPLPPPGTARRRGDVWELRVGPREFVPMENPLHRATRNAERLRRWLLEADQDHVVRVYAAVVGIEPGLERTPSCAVVPPDQLVAWLAALPAQRSFTTWRRARLVERLAERLG